jgi:hypothetical protein
VSSGTTYVFGRSAADSDDGSLWAWSYGTAWYGRPRGGSLAGTPALAGAPDVAPWVLGRNSGDSLQPWYYAAPRWYTADAGGRLHP